MGLNKTDLQMFEMDYKMRCETFGCGEDGEYFIGRPDAPLSTAMIICAGCAATLVESVTSLFDLHAKSVHAPKGQGEGGNQEGDQVGNEGDNAPGGTQTPDGTVTPEDFTGEPGVTATGTNGEGYEVGDEPDAPDQVELDDVPGETLTVTDGEKTSTVEVTEDGVKLQAETIVLAAGTYVDEDGSVGAVDKVVDAEIDEVTDAAFENAEFATTENETIEVAEYTEEEIDEAFEDGDVSLEEILASIRSHDDLTALAVELGIENLPPREEMKLEDRKKFVYDAFPDGEDGVE